MDWGRLPSEQVRALARRAPSDPTRILARLECAFALRHDEPERCVAIAREEISNALQRGNRHALAVGYIVSAYSGIVDEPDALLEKLRLACDLCAEIGDSRYEIRAADLLSTVFESMGDYPTALSYTETSLRRAREVGDRLFEGYGLSSLAGILTAAGDLDGALARLNEALVIAEEIDVIRLRCRLLIRKGRVERASGRIDEALASFQQAQALAIEADAGFTHIDAITEVARWHEDKGAFVEAEALYQEALRRMTEDMRTVIGPTAMLGLARICMLNGQLERSIELVETLRTLAQRFSMRPVQCDATKLLSEALRRVGRFDAAFEALQEHLELREEIMKGEAERAVKKLQVKADLKAAQKDAEIYRLKYIELETMQTQLVESERMAVVGNLTAGLTHEMNTPLGAIRSSLDTIRRAHLRLQDALPAQLSPPMKASTSALAAAEATSREALGRLESLVGSLRRFSRLDEADYQHLDLADGLEATVEVLSSALPEGIRIQCDLQPVPGIRGWPGALNQAFMTLLKNATEALGQQGTIRVETQVLTRPTPQILVRIADDGPGIPDDLKARLFELELSREGRRARFRVGLATVQSVIQRHHGRIEVISRPGHGTEFRLLFPVEGATVPA